MSCSFQRVPAEDDVALRRKLSRPRPHDQYREAGAIQVNGNGAIAGGSVMGTSGARNPTLTLQAIAWRTADHIINNWKSIVK